MSSFSDNPYAAPESKVVVSDFGRPATFYGFAGFWRRFGAYFIDSIVLFFIQMALTIGAMVLLGATGNQEGPMAVGVTLGINLLSIVLAIGYYAGMESSASQATLGKQALGVKVTDLHGRRISFGRAVGRLFAKALSGIILGIGYIMIAFTEKKQGLHDMIAGTLVLKTR